MRLITYVAALKEKDRLTMEQWGKIMQDIKRVVANNLLEMVGSGIIYTEASFPEDVTEVIADNTDGEE